MSTDGSGDNLGSTSELVRSDDNDDRPTGSLRPRLLEPATTRRSRSRGDLRPVFVVDRLDPFDEPRVVVLVEWSSEMETFRVGLGRNHRSGPTRRRVVDREHSHRRTEVDLDGLGLLGLRVEDLDVDPDAIDNAHDRPPLLIRPF